MTAMEELEKALDEQEIELILTKVLTPEEKETLLNSKENLFDTFDMAEILADYLQYNCIENDELTAEGRQIEEILWELKDYI